MSPNSSLPSLRGKLILVAGSASKSADTILLERSHAYVKLVVHSVLNAGGGLVVYAAGDPLHSSGKPLLFDWAVINAVDVACPEPQLSPRLVIITSELNRTARMDVTQRQLLARLALRNVAEIVDIPDEVVTGGNIGDEQVDRAHAMIAIGGGKGVADRARKLLKRGAPVLPLDIRIGALSEDGDGAIALQKRMMTEPAVFFPHTATVAKRISLGLSLQEPIQELQAIADGSVAILGGEFSAKEQAAPIDILVLTALAVELAAAQTAFGIPETLRPQKTSIGINYWRSQPVRDDGSAVTCAITCFGTAGNTDAAAITAALLSELKPKHVVMIGIAAGMRDKCKLGQVVISERMVAYEGGAVLEGGKFEARPEIYKPGFKVQQDLAAYLARADQIVSRLSDQWVLHGIEFPADVTIGEVAVSKVPTLATIASGEQLLRDPDRFRQLRTIHGKIEVGEMEGIGVFAACGQHGVECLVLRGISDFGDMTKDNRFHTIAAQAAAIVAEDFVRFGLSTV